MLAFSSHFYILQSSSWATTLLLIGISSWYIIAAISYYCIKKRKRQASKYAHFENSGQDLPAAVWCYKWMTLPPPVLYCRNTWHCTTIIRTLLIKLLYRTVSWTIGVTIIFHLCAYTHMPTTVPLIVHSSAQPLHALRARAGLETGLLLLQA
jgi:hypothetical protein